jgi:hypothetical protein
MELLKMVFSMQSLPRCHKQYKYRIQLFEWETPAIKDVNTESEEATVLEAVTRQRLKDLVRDVMNCRVCQLAIAL